MCRADTHLVRTDGADRGGDPWDELLALRTPEAGPDVDEELEAALLAYKQQKAARWGAERFADELRRRDEAEEARPVWTGEALSPPVEASVEAQAVGGEPMTFLAEPRRIGFDPRFVIDREESLSPAIQEPDQEREPVAEPEPEPEPIPELIAEREPVPEPEAVPEPEPMEPAVQLPRFVPDAAWSAGSRAGKLERLPAALRNPHVPRPPAPDPQPIARSRRRRGGKHAAPEPVRTPTLTDAEWARMSPGARRLYGFEEPPSARRAG
jgi:hypothetical protein